jgi:hypothetical protein
LSTGLDYLRHECWKRFKEDREIEAEGQVLGIEDIQVYHFTESRLVLAVDLPIAGQPGRDINSRFSGMIEIDGSFWAISLKAQSATGSKCIVMS